MQAVGAGRERGAAILNLGSGEGLSLPCFTPPLVPGLCPTVKQQVSAFIWCHSDVQAGSRKRVWDLGEAWRRARWRCACKDWHVCSR